MSYPWFPLAALVRRPITYGVVKPGDSPPDGVRFVRGGDVRDGVVRAAALRTIDEGVSKQYGRTLLVGGELLVSLVGNPGEVALAPASLAGANIARQVGLVDLADDVDSKYVELFLRTPLGRRQLLRRQTGSVQKVINLADLKRVEVPLPPLGIQRAAAQAGAGFDDLIDNNRRRIEILEEMARLIYREWFVHFRFPAQEDVELMDSSLGPIPVGWGVAAFADLADFLNGFAFKPSDHWMDEGFPIIKIKELKEGVAADTPRYHGEDIPEKYFIDNGDLLFSWSADLDAYLWPGGPALLNQHLFVVRPHEVSEIFLFHSLRGRMGEFRARSQGTTMKHIKRSALSEVLTVVPDRSTRELFEESVGPMLDLQLNLTRQNRVLSEARDLLLPRLISGELDLSDLDLDLEPVA